MKEESFEKEFEKLRSMGEKTFVLRGSTLIVELFPKQELKTAGGLIIHTPDDHVGGKSIEAHRAEVGIVRMSGQGYWVDADDSMKPGAITYGHYEKLECQPGAIVVLPKYSLQLMSTFPGIERPINQKLCLVKMDQVLAYYPSLEAYETAKAELNA